MEEGDPLSFGADSRLLIDELKPCLSAALERRVEVIDRKANVMNSRPPLCQVAADGRAFVLGLEELDERFSGAESRDPRAIRVIEIDRRKPQHLAKEWNAGRERLNSDADVRNAGAAWG